MTRGRLGNTHQTVRANLDQALGDHYVDKIRILVSSLADRSLVGVIADAHNASRHGTGLLGDSHGKVSN